MRIAIFGGAGHIGSRVVRELNKRAPDAELIIADKNLEGAKRLASELGGNISAQLVDADDPKSLLSVMEGVDVAISTIGPYYKYGRKLLEAAIGAKTDFVDIDDDYDATRDCLELDAEAKRAGITAIIGLGASPGLTNLMAKHGAEKLDQVDEIHTAWAWTALDPRMGPAIIAHYFHAITGKIPTYRDGKWIEIPAFSEPEIVEFPPPLNGIEVRHCGHPEPLTIPRYIRGVKVVTNKGVIWPKILADVSRTLADLGWTSLKELKIDGVSVPLRDILVRLTLVLPEFISPETLDAAVREAQERYGDYMMGAGFRAEVKGERRGKEVRYAYGVACPSATLSTALPTAIGALMIARGEVEGKGVFAPEGIIDPRALLKEIAREMEIVEIEEKALELP